MKQIEYELPVFTDSDKADLNLYSSKMAEALKTQIDKINENAENVSEKLKKVEETDSAIQADITAIKTDVDALKTDNESNKTDITKLKETTSKNATEIEAIKKEQTTQNEKIEQNASNIEQNTDDIQQNKAETDEEIAKLKEENKLLKAQIPEGTASGNDIHLEDSSNMPFEWKINGGSRQKNREGYNLLIPPKTQSKSGITFTINDDNSVTVNGTAEENASINFVNKEESMQLSLKKGTYILTGCPKGGSDTTYRLGANLNGNIFDTGDGATIIVPEDVFNKVVWLIVYKGTTVNNLTFYPMLIKSTEEKLYEPYGVSPSPEYPSKIENVESDVKMTVCNKNFLNILDAAEKKVSGVTYSIKNGVIILNGTATQDFQINLITNIRLKSDTYTHSCNELKTGMFISFDDIGETMLSGMNRKTITFKINEDTTYSKYFIYISKGTAFNNFILKLLLEKGKIATDYIPHEGQIITFLLTKGQKLYKNSYLASDGIHNKRKQIVLTGNENLWGLNTNYTTDELLVVQIQLNDVKTGTYNCLSNYFKYYNTSTVKNTMRFAGQFLAITLDKKEFNTVDDFKIWLSTHNLIVEYELATEEIIPYTPEQQKVIDTALHTYKNITNISIDNELATLDITYKKDIETILNNKDKEYNERLSNIENLLSTTSTSALLLDNLENDLKEEV